MCVQISHMNQEKEDKDAHNDINIKESPNKNIIDSNINNENINEDIYFNQQSNNANKLMEENF